jgi:predicted short-subunit dehydrogenase-like oxidoreductase (DUF2520 family)
MKGKPRIAIVGAGRLGTSLVIALSKAGYKIAELLVRHPDAASRRLAAGVRARLSTPARAALECEVVWFCVPDRAIASAAYQLRSRDWKGKVALHSSGALPSGELKSLHRLGASIASVHPMMTFVRGTQPEMDGVPFALEGEAAAVRTARQVVRDLGGKWFMLPASAKPLYHAWGGLLSPLLVAHLACAEKVARAAGVPAARARRDMLPIVLQTIRNYARFGAGRALTGPLARGDVATIRRHLPDLKRVAEAERVYRALALFAVRQLPVKEGRQLERLLDERPRRVSAK